VTGNMKSDTIAVHGGYETEPTTRAVAVPIYQTVAYEFESADHGAALFNLEVEGHRYSRISNPTTAVLERRIAELEGGVEALCTSTEALAKVAKRRGIPLVVDNTVATPIQLRCGSARCRRRYRNARCWCPCRRG